MRSAFVVEGLLPARQHRRLLEASVAEERWFVEASTDGREGYRRAAVLYTVVDEALWVVDRVRHWASAAARSLGLELPDEPRIEHQITAYRDGDRYGAHRDDEGRDPAGRSLTYVYYYHRWPRAFRGGELILCPDDAAQTIEPRCNQLVFFPSAWSHEVRPVAAPSDFGACRFSVNGWLWRAPASPG